MISPNPINAYVVEGLDGVGKSTVAKALADKIKADYVATPLPELRKKKAMFDTGSNLLGRFFYYMEGNYHLSDKINDGGIGLPIVIDRYIVSTLAYHNAMLKEDTFKYVKWENLFVPKIGFYLFAEKEARLNRMRNRENLTRTDLIFERNHNLARRIEDQYNLLTKDYVRIDTTRLNQKEVVDIIYKKINNNGGN